MRNGFVRHNDLRLTSADRDGIGGDRLLILLPRRARRRARERAERAPSLRLSESSEIDRLAYEVTGELLMVDTTLLTTVYG
jgi:hypothetical protein